MDEAKDHECRDEAESNAGDLSAHMSAYLARRIEQTPNLEVLLKTTVRAMRGDNHLREIEIVKDPLNPKSHYIMTSFKWGCEYGVGREIVYYRP